MYDNNVSSYLFNIVVPIKKNVFTRSTDFIVGYKTYWFADLRSSVDDLVVTSDERARRPD